MANDRDELYTRHEKREALRKKQQMEQRKMVFGLVAAVLILVCVIVGIIVIANDAGKKADHNEGLAAAGITVPSETTKATEPTETTRARRDPLTTIHIKAAGDLNVTTNVVDAGLAASGFDFTRAFMDVAPVLSDADLTILNLEGNICGEPYGSASTSAPKDLLDGLRSAGVDLLQVANSCSINNGLIGMTTTLQAIRASGIEPVGAFSSEAEWKRSGGYTIMEVQGIRIAFVAFTKGVGGMGMPAGNENLVNLLYTDYSSTYRSIDKDRITKTMDRVNAERPDLVIVMLHWGSEYNDVISDTQKSIVSLLQKKGADVIIGTHPHLVQEVSYDPLSGNLVAYSLGDFFGDATRGGTSYSIILDLEITKDTDTGITKVTGWDYVPIYTLKETDCDGYQRVVRIKEAMFAFESNFVDRVTQACYDDMKYSLERITSRLSGKG